MSKELTKSELAKVSKLKLYTEREFLDLKGASNRQERLVAAVLDNREHLLSDRDARYLQLLKRAYNILMDNISPLHASRKIEKLMDVPSRARVKQVIRDVRSIFNDFEESNREWDRWMLTHKISKYIDQLKRKDPESKNIPDMYKLLVKLKGLDQHDSQTINWDEVHMPVVERTSDPVFASGPATDIDHEELTPDGSTAKK